MNEEIGRLFKQAEEDQELAKKIFEAESAAEVKEVAAKVGIELTEEEIKESGKAIVEELEGQGDELSEDDLDNVAGGVAFTTVAAVTGAVMGATRAYIAADNKVEAETGQDIDDHVKDGFNTAVDTISGWF